MMATHSSWWELWPTLWRCDANVLESLSVCQWQYNGLNELQRHSTHTHTQWHHMSPAGCTDGSTCLFDLFVQASNVAILLSRSFVQLHRLDTRVIPTCTHVYTYHTIIKRALVSTGISGDTPHECKLTPPVASLKWDTSPYSRPRWSQITVKLAPTKQQCTHSPLDHRESTPPGWPIQWRGESTSIGRDEENRKSSQRWRDMGGGGGREAPGERGKGKIRKRWVHKHSGKEPSPAQPTCLVDVLMTAHFPFRCESRSMCPPSSSAWSWGSTSRIWGAGERGEGWREEEWMRGYEWRREGRKRERESWRRRGREGCCPVDDGCIGKPALGSPPYLHHVGDEVRENFKDFDLFCILLQTNDHTWSTSKDNNSIRLYLHTFIFSFIACCSLLILEVSLFMIWWVKAIEISPINASQRGWALFRIGAPASTARAQHGVWHLYVVIQKSRTADDLVRAHSQHFLVDGLREMGTVDMQGQNAREETSATTFASTRQTERRH